MTVTLTKELEALVAEKVRSGRYADASDVMRDALRRLELDDGYQSPALEAGLLEGVHSPHRPYGKGTLTRVRKAAASIKASSGEFDVLVGGGVDGAGIGGEGGPCGGVFGELNGVSGSVRARRKTKKVCSIRGGARCPWSMAGRRWRIPSSG